MYACVLIITIVIYIYIYSCMCVCLIVFMVFGGSLFVCLFVLAYAGPSYRPIPLILLPTPIHVCTNTHAPQAAGPSAGGPPMPLHTRSAYIGEGEGLKKC